jgi:hypothetical protein
MLFFPLFSTKFEIYVNFFKGRLVNKQTLSQNLLHLFPVHESLHGSGAISTIMVTYKFRVSTILPSHYCVKLNLKPVKRKGHLLLVIGFYDNGINYFLLELYSILEITETREIQMLLH